jgi:hypothetical protein
MTRRLSVKSWQAWRCVAQLIAGNLEPLDVHVRRLPKAHQPCISTYSGRAYYVCDLPTPRYPSKTSRCALATFVGMLERYQQRSLVERSTTVWVDGTGSVKEGHMRTISTRHGPLSPLEYHRPRPYHIDEALRFPIPLSTSAHLHGSSNWRYLAAATRRGTDRGRTSPSIL